MTEGKTDLTPAYEITEDGGCGIILMTVRGFFDPRTLSRHFSDNREAVERWRSAGRLVRVLIDASQLMPHTPECQLIVQAATASIYRTGDKVAVLVSSSLVKMQMRRALIEGDTIEFFLSQHAARLWLDPRPGAIVERATTSSNTDVPSAHPKPVFLGRPSSATFRLPSAS